MLRIFIDPATKSTGVFANRDDKEIYFFNPKQDMVSGAKLAEKYRNVKIMISRIIWCLRQVATKAEEVEIYVEAPFVGQFNATIELAGMSFLLIDRILRFIKSELGGGAELFMLAPRLVSGKDSKAKRPRKERKPFAIQSYEMWYAWSLPQVCDPHLLKKAGDDVATAFLFWYYCFGPGLEPKPKDRPTLSQIPLDYYENIMTGEDHGQEQD